MSDNWTDEDWRATLAASEGLREDAEERVRALTAQVVERDAVIEQADQWSHAVVYGENPRRTWADLAAIFAQAPRDALVAHDKTVRATALRDAAGEADSMPAEVRPDVSEWPDWLRARADQEEGKA